jgi:glyoxylase I family protein
MLKRLDHVEIVPGDFARSLAFYTDVLGFKVDHRIAVNAPPLNEVVYLTLGGSAIELLRVDVPAPASRRIGEAGYNAMAWEVDDMDGTLHDLAAKGIAPTWGPRRSPGYIRAEIADPDGNSIELREWRRKPDGHER